MLLITSITFLYFICLIQYETEAKTVKKEKSTEYQFPPYATDNKVIMYHTRDNDVEKNIKSYLSEIEENTCLKFEKQSRLITRIGINFFRSIFDDQVEISKSKLRPTNVYLTANTYNRHKILKFFIGYALGLIPEVARKDRDSEINVNKNNISSSYEKYFEVVKDYPKSYYETDFDFSSVMLFSPFFGGKNGKLRTYSPKLTPFYEKIIEQYNDFVFNDFKRLSNLYCKDTCKNSKKCQNNGYYTEDCSHCQCPFPYGGNQCEVYAPATGDCGNERDIIASSRKISKTIQGLSGECYFLIKSSDVKKKVKLIIEEFKGVKNRYLLEIKYREDKGAKGIIIDDGVKKLELPPLSNSILISFVAYHPENKLKVSYQAV